METRSPAAGGLCLIRCCLGGLATWWDVGAQSSAGPGLWLFLGQQQLVLRELWREKRTFAARKRTRRWSGLTHLP